MSGRMSERMREWISNSPANAMKLAIERKKRKELWLAFHFQYLPANPKMWNDNSVMEAKARPPIIGMRLRLTIREVVSPITTRVIRTVKIGAELFTVSVKLTATYSNATRPTKESNEGDGTCIWCNCMFPSNLNKTNRTERSRFKFTDLIIQLRIAWIPRRTCSSKILWV